jgi:hypothetical protein
MQISRSRVGVRRLATAGVAHAGVVHAAAALVVAVEAGAMYRLGAGGYFYVDDFLNLMLAKQNGLRLGYLLWPVWNHFIPGFRLVHWLAERLFPLEYHAILAFDVAAYAASAALLYRLLDRLFGTSLWNVLLVAAYGFSAIWLPVVLWGASGVEILPALAFAILCVDSWLRYVATRRGGWLALAVAACCAALFFYEKGLLLAVYLPLLTALLRSPSARPRELAAAVVREWRGWIALAAPIALYLAFFMTHYYRVPGATPTAGQLLRFYWLAWTRAFVPAYFGGPLRWDWIWPGGTANAAPPAWLAVAAQAALLGLLVLSLARNRRAWRGWAFLAVAFAVNAFPAAWARIGLWGVDQVALDFHYLVESSFLLTLALAMAFLPRAGSGDPAPGRPSRPASVALLAGGSAVAILFVASAIPYGANWSRSYARDYVQNYRTSLAAALGRDPGLSLYDATVPEAIAPWYPYSRYSEFLGLVGAPPSYDDPSRPLYVLDGRGEVVRARLAAAASARPSAVPHCGRTFTVPLDRAVGKALWFLRLDYRAAAPARVRLALVGGQGDQGGASGWVELRAGSGPLLVALPPSSGDGVSVEAAAGGEICAESLQLGKPEPAG